MASKTGSTTRRGTNQTVGDVLASIWQRYGGQGSDPPSLDLQITAPSGTPEGVMQREIVRLEGDIAQALQSIASYHAALAIWAQHRAAVADAL